MDCTIFGLDPEGLSLQLLGTQDLALCDLIAYVGHYIRLPAFIRLAVFFSYCIFKLTLLVLACGVATLQAAEFLCSAAIPCLASREVPYLGSQGDLFCPMQR